jgi:hypothetical protein
MLIRYSEVEGFTAIVLDSVQYLIYFRAERIVLSVIAAAKLAVRWKWIDRYFGGMRRFVLRQGMQ